VSEERERVGRVWREGEMWEKGSRRKGDKECVKAEGRRKRRRKKGNRRGFRVERRKKVEKQRKTTKKGISTVLFSHS
jgi:hypothetical protein